MTQTRVNAAMPSEQVLKATLVVPSAEAEDAVRSLSEYNFFHPEEELKGTKPVLRGLVEEYRDLRIRLRDLAQGLEVSTEPGVLDSILRGRREPGEFLVSDWKELLDQVSTDAEPILSEGNSLLQEVEEVEQEIQRLTAIKATLTRVAELYLDLEKTKALENFVARVVLMRGTDAEEVRSSLPDQIVEQFRLEDDLSAFLVAGPREDAVRIERALELFGAEPLDIPAGLPSVPAEAHKTVDEQLAEVWNEKAALEDELSSFVESHERKISELVEAADIAYEALRRLRTPEDLDHFVLLRGYIPSTRLTEFRDELGKRWKAYVSSPDPEDASGVPSLSEGTSWIASFGEITATQGFPEYGELDPTPAVALFFPIFYGLMFGDMGHGAVLLLLGVVLKVRGTTSLKRWGTVLLMSGLSAFTVGLLLGEAFGFPVPIHVGPLPVLHLVEAGHLGFNAEAVNTILVLSLFLGVIHISLGFVLRIWNELGEGHVAEAVTFSIPSLAMYVFGIMLAFAFFGADMRLGAILTATGPVPILGLPSNLVGTIGLGGAVLATAVVFIGRPARAILGIDDEPVGEAFMMGVIEVLENVISFLANTISYTRLGILLFVHVALLLVVNLGTSLGTPGLVIIILGNAGVFVLEALIVYIHDLRLHVYEWFTKFYGGTGKRFVSLMPEALNVKIRWT